jgi:cytochrome c peroxidase
MNMRRVGSVGGGRAPGRAVRAFACIAAGAALLGGVEIARGGAPSSERQEPKLSATQKNLVELGRRLFFDPALSSVGANACASCHHAEHGFGDPRRFSPEDVGQTLRHSQALIDIDRDSDQHWDGEFLSVAALVESRTRSMGTPSGYGGRPETTPGRRSPRGDFRGRDVSVDITPGVQEILAGVVANAPSPGRDLGIDREDLPATGVVLRHAGRVFESGFEEMSLGMLAGVSDGTVRIAQSKRYLEALTALGAGAKAGTLDHELAGEAIEAYVATIRSSRSPYDRFRAGEQDALSASAKRGLDLFRGPAGCVSCHKETGPQGWPTFRDGAFHNNGIAWMNEDKRVSVVALNGLQIKPSEGRFLDEGRGRFLSGKQRVRAFKTPSLRDVARHPPYMHDGSKATLEDVVVHYASGCGDDPDRDERLRGFEASQQDIKDLVAFLESLTSEERPGLAKEAWKKRAERTRLRFVDLKGQPLAGLLMGLQVAGDKVPTNVPVPLPPSLETDSQGEIGYVVPASTHVRIRPPEWITVVGGDLVPDTCASVDVTLQVTGRVRLALVSEDSSIGMPEVLRAYEPTTHGGLAIDGKARAGVMRGFFPTPWVLTRVGTLNLGERTAVLYEGFGRRIGARSLAFRLPGQKAPQEVVLDVPPVMEAADAPTQRVDVLAEGSREWRGIAR